jgi:hypothetical protein
MTTGVPFKSAGRFNSLAESNFRPAVFTYSGFFIPESGHSGVRGVFFYFLPLLHGGILAASACI